MEHKILTTEKRQFLEELIKTRSTVNTQGGYRSYYINRKHFNILKIKRSRAIMMLHLNRELSIHEIVHHKNGDKTDDRIENLEITTSEEHASYHAGRRR